MLLLIAYILFKINFSISSFIPRFPPFFCYVLDRIYCSDFVASPMLFVVLSSFMSSFCEFLLAVCISDRCLSGTTFSTR